MQRAPSKTSIGQLLNNHHVALHGDYAHVIFAAKQKDEFRQACMCVQDNAGEGYVLTPTGHEYHISRYSRSAKLSSTTGEKRQELIERIDSGAMVPHPAVGQLIWNMRDGRGIKRLNKTFQQ